MTTREEAIKQVNVLFDRIEAEGRHVVGFAAAVPHMGPRDGLEHTTLESETCTLHHPRMVTALVGSIEALAQNARSLWVYPDFPEDTGRPVSTEGA